MAPLAMAAGRLLSLTALAEAAPPPAAKVHKDETAASAKARGGPKAAASAPPQRPEEAAGDNDEEMGTGSGAVAGGRRPAADKEKPELGAKATEMTAVMLKALLNLLHRQALMEAVAYRTFILKTEHPVAKAIVDTGTLYAANCRALGRQHELGPPHPHFYAATLRALHASGAEAIGEENLRKIGKFLESWEALGVAGQCSHIRACRTDKTYSSKTKRLTLSFGDSQLSCEVIDALKKTGGEEKHGKAPRGAMEDQLAAWLRSLSK